MRLAAKPRAIVRSILSSTLYPEGAIRTILFGPGRGLRYRIFRDYGLSPLYGGWEPEAEKLMLKHLRPSSVVYDLGANYGIHTLLMARHADHVYAFEPAPEIRRELEQNVALNGLNNVTVLPFAVCDGTAARLFSAGHHKGAGHLIVGSDRPANPQTVDTISLDDCVFVRGYRPPTFVKIDVEGSESSVLAGAHRVLSDVRPVILIDLHSPSEDVAVGNLLWTNGYTAYRTGKTGKVEKVTDLTKGWPSPDGIWGQIIAVP